MVAVRFLPELQYPGPEGTGKVIYKPSVLDEKQLHLNRIDREAIKCHLA